MPFHDLKQAKSITLADGVIAHPAWGERVMLVRLELEANSVVPLHTHPHEQAGMVLEGELDFTLGDETRHLTAGDSYIVPSNVTHGVTMGSAPAVALDVFSPPREEYKTD